MRTHGAVAGRGTQIIGLLNTLLSDEYVLYTKTRNYHWNVVGIQFHSLHKLFEEQYEELNALVDEIAERVRAIGGKPVATLAGFLKNTTLREGTEALDAKGMISQLLNDHEAVVRGLQECVETAEREKDAGSVDLLTDAVKKHEKFAWMLKASLETARI